MGNNQSNQLQYKTFSLRMRCKFNLEENEIILDKYHCAFVSSILLQGKLYITPNYIIFHSYFNDITLFHQTNIKIPYEDLLYFQKMNGLLRIKNTIYLETEKKSYTFTSFLSRDKCFGLISENWIKKKNSKLSENPVKELKNELKVSSKNNTKDNDNNNNTDDTNNMNMMTMDALETTNRPDSSSSSSYILDKSPEKKIELSDMTPQKFESYEEKIANRKEQIISKISPISLYNVIPYSYTIQGTDLQQYYKLIFNNTPFILDGTTYSNWFELVSKRSGVKEIPEITEWQPKPEFNLRNIKTIANLECDCFERVVKGTKPLRGGGPFTPKFINYMEEQRLYVLDNKEMLMISDLTFLGKFPFSDSFKYISCWVIKQINQDEVMVEYRYAMEFIKPVIFKGMIEKATLEEQKEVGKMVNELINEIKNNGYFKVETSASSGSNDD